MDEKERIRLFCRSYAMAQRLLDMAVETPIHMGMAVNEARKELAKAYELFPVTVKSRIGHLGESLKKINFPHEPTTSQFTKSADSRHALHPIAHDTFLKGCILQK